MGDKGDDDAKVLDMYGPEEVVNDCEETRLQIQMTMDCNEIPAPQDCRHSSDGTTRTMYSM